MPGSRKKYSADQQKPCLSMLKQNYGERVEGPLTYFICKQCEMAQDLTINKSPEE